MMFATGFSSDIGGVSVAFLSVNDLRPNKLASGRLRDLADAAELPPERGE